MYGGQPLPPSHHGQQPFSVPDDMPVHLHGQPIMDAPDFGGFGYSFDAPIHHDPGPPMMPLPSQQAALHHHHQPHPAHQQHHQHSSFVAPDAHSIHTPPVAHHEPRPDTSSVPRPSFDAGIQPDRRPSATPSIAAQPERKSSLIPDALDDSAADGTDLGAKTKDANKSDAPPPWSELKTKAGKDRKRLPLACIACRRKKIRCSGEKPACKHCLRSRTPCVYKVTTRKAAPRTDYMAMLDKRLKRMEDRIIKIIPKSDQGSTANVTRAVVKPAIPGTLGSNKPLSRKRGADDAFGPDFEAWAQQSPEPGPETDDSLEAHEDDENKLFHEGRDALPPKETQEHLAEVYFDHIYGQAYPLLHKPSYMRKLK